MTKYFCFILGVLFSIFECFDDFVTFNLKTEICAFCTTSIRV